MSRRPCPSCTGDGHEPTTSPQHEGGLAARSRPCLDALGHHPSNPPHHHQDRIHDLGGLQMQTEKGVTWSKHSYLSLAYVLE